MTLDYVLRVLAVGGLLVLSGLWLALIVGLLTLFFRTFDDVHLRPSRRGALVGITLAAVAVVLGVVVVGPPK